MKARYESEFSRMKEPTKALKAVVLPTYIAPRTERMRPQAKVALKGFSHFLSIFPIHAEKGVASSRPRVHSMRPAVM